MNLIAKLGTPHQHLTETSDDYWAVTLYFNFEEDAKEWYRLAKISKDIDDELLLYGDGVLRTLEKKNATKSRRKSRQTK
jgi:hypothetical protein